MVMRKARPAPLSPEERAFDLGTWLKRHATTATATGSEWLIACPLCGGDKLAVNVARKAWQCWRARCGFRGWSPYVLVAAVAEVDLFAALEIVHQGALASDAPVDELPRDDRPQREMFRMLPPAPMPPGTVRGLRPTQLEYVRSRRVPMPHAEAFGLGTVLGDGSETKANWLLRGRVLFPVWTHQRLTFWTTRSTDPNARIKTLHLPLNCKVDAHPPGCACVHEEWGLTPTPGCAASSEQLLGLHLVQPDATVVLVEGPMDAVVVGPGAVCTFGARVHPHQVAALARMGVREVVVAYDGDDAGRRGATLAALELGAFIPTRIAHLPAGADPGDLGRDAVLHLVESASESLDAIPALSAGNIVDIAGPSSPPSPTDAVRPL